MFGSNGKAGLTGRIPDSKEKKKRKEKKREFYSRLVSEDALLDLRTRRVQKSDLTLRNRKQEASVVSVNAASRGSLGAGKGDQQERQVCRAGATVMKTH